MWKSGIVLAPQTFHRDQRLEHQRQVGRQHDRVLAHDRREAADEHADADVLQRHAFVVEHQLVDVGGEPRLVDVRVARPVEQHVEHRLLVHAREAGEQIDDLAPAARREPADHAEVDHRRCGCRAGRTRCPGADRRGRSRRSRIIFRNASAPRAASTFLSRPAASTAARIVAGNAIDVLLHQQRLARPLPDRSSG